MGDITQPRFIVAAGLCWLSARVLLLQRRPAHARHGAGRLELPGGKVEPGEAPAGALARELVEEWGPHAAVLRVAEIADVLHHVYPPPGPEVVLCVYHVDARDWREGWSDRIALEPGASAEAHPIDRLPVDEFLAADRDLLARIGRFRPSFIDV